MAGMPDVRQPPRRLLSDSQRALDTVLGDARLAPHPGRDESEVEMDDAEPAMPPG